MDINPEALRRARVAAGLSLAQVGGVELTRQAVHLIETGKVRPSMRSLRILARRLQVPVAALLAPGSGGPPLPEGSIAELDHLCRGHEYEQVLVRGRALLDWGQPPEVAADVHYFMGQAFCLLMRPEEAMTHLQQARVMFDSLDDDQGRVAETLELEALALQLSEDPRALRVAEEALRRYRAVDGRRPEVESRLLQRLGNILIGHLDHAAAKACYEEAIQVANGVRDLVRLARIYHGLAACNLASGDMRAASELLFKAHTLYEAEERLGGTSSRNDMVALTNDIGIMLVRQGDLARGEEYLTEARDRLQREGLGLHMSHVLLSFTELRRAQGRLDDAIECTEQAIEQAERTRETRALAVGHQQLGELLAARGQRARAEASFERALATLRGAGLERHYAACLAVRDRALGHTALDGTAGA